MKRESQNSLKIRSDERSTPLLSVNPLFIGTLELSSPVIYSALAGCSDFPFRQMVTQFQPPGLMFCEMVKMEPLVRGDKKTYRLLDYDSAMHPIGAQLCGSNPAIAGQAAMIIEELGFDVVDLNCGCPVDKVTKDGSGSGLLKNIELIGEILSNMVAAVSIPVTLKIRAGWDEQSINAAAVTALAESVGARAVFVHGRTRKQAYKGPANWDHIRDCVEVADQIKVIGNGDIMQPQDAIRMFETTGCDGVLVSRGTFGQPWMAEDIRKLLSGKEVQERGFDQKRAALLDHFLYITRYQNEKKSLIDMRRVGCWYFTKEASTRSLREAISRAASLDEVESIIRNLETS